MRITENQALKWDLCRFFAIAQNDKISCHTERSEVSTLRSLRSRLSLNLALNLKCEFALLKRILNSLDISLRSI